MKGKLTTPLVNILEGDFEYIAKGGFGCVFQGNIDGIAKRYIKFSYKSDNGLNIRRDAIMGNFVTGSNLVGGTDHWVQTHSWGSVERLPNAFRNLNEQADYTECIVEFDKMDEIY